MTKTAISTREICIVALFTAITAVLAQIVLPTAPIPISFAMVAIYLCGILLRPKCAFLTQICYLLLGAVGVPVFSYFRGGLQMLVGPTGGYLLAYPLTAVIISGIVNGGKNRDRGGELTPALYLRTTLALVLGIITLYAAGTLWMSLISGISFGEAAAVAVLPFIPLDIVKIAICVLGVLPVRRRLMRMGLTGLTA